MKDGKVLCVGATIVVRAYKRAVAMAYVGAAKGIVTYIKTETALYVCASGLFTVKFAPT